MWRPWGAQPPGDPGCLSGSPEPPSAASFSLAGLAPDLQHILFWMSNSVELLYFVQQRCPLYMQSLEEELDVTGELCAGPRHAAPLGSAVGQGRATRPSPGTALCQPRPLLHVAEFQREACYLRERRACDGKLGD